MSDISASDLATLHEVMFCANGWEPEARLIGNVCAGDIVSAINNVVTELDKSDDIIEQLKSEIERNALPRALRWTHEPPKVAGAYYTRDTRFPEGTGIVQITSQQAERLTKKGASPFIQYAGPIAPPIE